jgi:hypothetical protein
VGCCVDWVCEVVGTEIETDEVGEDVGGVEADEVSDSVEALLTCCVESEGVVDCWGCDWEATEVADECGEL